MFDLFSRRIDSRRSPAVSPEFGRSAKLRNENLEQFKLELYVHPAPDVVSECVSRFGHWEAVETRFVLETVKPGQVVLDLGANIGYYTALFSRLVGASGRVLAFEPEDSNFGLLTMNIIRNGLTNVETYKVIVGADCGIGQLRHHNTDNRRPYGHSR